MFTGTQKNRAVSIRGKYGDETTMRTNGFHGISLIFMI